MAAIFLNKFNVCRSNFTKMNVRGFLRSLNYDFDVEIRKFKIPDLMWRLFNT